MAGYKVLWIRFSGEKTQLKSKSEIEIKEESISIFRHSHSEKKSSVSCITAILLARNVAFLYHSMWVSSRNLGFGIFTIFSSTVNFGIDGNIFSRAFNF